MAASKNDEIKENLDIAVSLGKKKERRLKELRERWEKEGLENPKSRFDQFLRSFAQLMFLKSRSVIYENCLERHPFELLAKEMTLLAEPC